MKIIINKIHSGFGIPTQIKEMYLVKKGIEHYWYEIVKVNDNFSQVYERKHYNDLDLSVRFHFPVAHLTDIGDTVTLSSDPEEGIPWEQWDSTRIHFEGYVGEKVVGMMIESRTDPVLVEILEGLPSDYITLLKHIYHPKVVEIPDGVEWTIEEYDGLEWVAEKHRKWG